jgi:hypothetical protein
LLARFGRRLFGIWQATSKEVFIQIGTGICCWDQRQPRLANGINEKQDFAPWFIQTAAILTGGEGEIIDVLVERAETVVAARGR